MARTKRPKETDEMVDGLRRQFRAIENRSDDEDPWLIADLIELRDELDAMAIRIVANMRGRGLTWRDIGYNLNLDGEQARKKFAPKIGGKNS